MHAKPDSRHGTPRLPRAGARAGRRPEPFQARFGIDADLDDEHAFVLFASYVRLLASSEGLACPDFGLRMSQWQGLEILGPIAVIARNARTVEDGVRAIVRYLYVHSPALTLNVEQERASKRHVRVTLTLREQYLPKVTQAYELSMALSARIIRLLRARMPGRAWCDSGTSSRSADPETSRVATKYLESRFLPPAAALSDRAALLARQLLPTGLCSVDEIANQLAMHPRTLQRRLADEGTRCQDVIDGERRLLAVKYLARPGLQLGQIAGLLGYTEQSALNRSCRRWFGTTPRHYGLDLATVGDQRK